MSIAFLRSFKKRRPVSPPTPAGENTGGPDEATFALAKELDRMPDRERLLELLRDCATMKGPARNMAPRLCYLAYQALRAVEDSFPPHTDKEPKEIADSLTGEERDALLNAAWAQVDDGDSKIKMHPGSYPPRLHQLGLCQNWIIPATWKSDAEQRATCEYGITRFGLIVAMHLKNAPKSPPPEDAP